MCNLKSVEDVYTFFKEDKMKIKIVVFLFISVFTGSYCYYMLFSKRKPRKLLLQCQRCGTRHRYICVGTYIV